MGHDQAGVRALLAAMPYRYQRLTHPRELEALHTCLRAFLCLTSSQAWPPPGSQQHVEHLNSCEEGSCYYLPLAFALQVRKYNTMVNHSRLGNFLVDLTINNSERSFFILS